MRKIIVTVAGLVLAAGTAIGGTAAQAGTDIRPPSCASQLAAIRLVGRQAGIRVGSTHLRAVTDTGPRTWAAELRRVGITDGSERAALRIHSLASAQVFIAYLEQDSAGALLGWHCSR